MYKSRIRDSLIFVVGVLIIFLVFTPAIKIIIGKIFRIDIQAYSIFLEMLALIFVLPLLSCYISERYSRCIYKGNINLKNVLLTLGYMCLTSFVIFFYLVLIQVISNYVPFISSQIKDVNEITKNSSSLIIKIIVTGIMAPIGEELVFRGAIFNELKRYVSPKLAIFLSGLIFAIMHFNAFQFAYTLILGICLGYVYEKFGSIWYPIIIHVSYNTLQILPINNVWYLPIYVLGTIFLLSYLFINNKRNIKKF